MQRFAATYSRFFGVLRNPRSAMIDVARRGNAREGQAAMLVLGAVHAAFSLLLYLSGHSPRRGIPGLAGESHYLYQAIFIIPLYCVLFWIGGLVAHSTARRLSGAGSRPASLAVFGVAYAIPMIVLFLLPDIAVFLALGFGAIGKAMRWYAPVAAIACMWLGAVGLSRVHGIKTRYATVAVFTGFVAQALVGGFFLR